MKKLHLLLVLILLVSVTTGIWAKKAATFTEFSDPYTIEVDKTQIYVTQGVNIYIYSSKDYSFIKRFGKAGEGTGEFNVKPNHSVHTFVHDDFIRVNSIGKVSFFKKNGEFIKEVNSGKVNEIRFFANKFVGRTSGWEDDVNYTTVKIFDAEMNKIKDILKYKATFQGENGYRAFPIPYVYDACDNKVYIAGDEDFVINVLDADGKPLFVIKQEYQKRKVTEKDKKELMDRYKNDPRYIKFYEYLKKYIKFPEYFPAIRHFRFDRVDKKLYVKTQKEKDEKFEHFVYDLKGKFLKRTYIHLPRKKTMASYPYTFYSNNVYRLLYNPDTGSWELHMDEIN